MKNSISLILTLFLSSFLIGCANNTSSQDITSITITNKSTVPGWVTDPVVGDGLAAVECVSWSENFSADRKQATEFARSNLVKQVELKASMMDDTFTRRVDLSQGSYLGNTFKSVSKQVAEQALTLTLTEKAEIVKLAGIPQLCVLVTLTPEITKKLVYQLIQQSNKRLSSPDIALLYQEFRTHKQPSRLKDELSRI